MPKSYKQKSAISNKENDDELCSWFQLVLEFRANGFTPEQVKVALFNQSQVVKKSMTTSTTGFETQLTGSNKSWCW